MCKARTGVNSFKTRYLCPLISVLSSLFPSGGTSVQAPQESPHFCHWCCKARDWKGWKHHKQLHIYDFLLVLSISALWVNGQVSCQTKPAKIYRLTHMWHVLRARLLSWAVFGLVAGMCTAWPWAVALLHPRQASAVQAQSKDLSDSMHIPSKATSVSVSQMRGVQDAQSVLLPTPVCKTHSLVGSRLY